jgi:hypothetical protein
MTRELLARCGRTVNREIILAELSSGPKSRDHLNSAASQGSGASSETTLRQLKKLKAEGKVKCHKDGFGGERGWIWTLVGATSTDDDIPF